METQNKRARLIDGIIQNAVNENLFTGAIVYDMKVAVAEKMLG